MWVLKMTPTERERVVQAVVRRHTHLERLQQARADVIVAEARLRAARQAAFNGGCTPDEVAGAVAMIDRAAERTG